MTSTLLLLFLSLSVQALAQVTPAVVTQPPATGDIPLTPPIVGGIPFPPPQEPAVGGIPMIPPALGGIPFLPEIPGIIGIGLRPGKGSGNGKEKCGSCNSDCMKKKRNRWGYAACMAGCSPKCINGILSDSEFHCIQSCALSASPRVFSDSDEGNNYINYCYQSCRN